MEKSFLHTTVQNPNHQVVRLQAKGVSLLTLKGVRLWKVVERKRYGRLEEAKGKTRQVIICYYRNVGHNLKILVKEFHIAMDFSAPTRQGKLCAKVNKGSKQQLQC